MFNGYMQTLADVLTFFLVKAGDIFFEFIKTSLVVIGFVLAFGAAAGGIWTLIIIKGTIL
jgi:hypothetical protein